MKKAKNKRKKEKTICRLWSPKCRSEKFQDRREKRQRTRSAKLRAELKSI